MVPTKAMTQPANRCVCPTKLIKRVLWALTILLPLAAQAQYVTLGGKVQASNGIPASDYTLGFTLNQQAFVAGTGVVVNTATSCATSADGTVVGTPNPLYATIVTPQFSGETPPGNYYVEYTFVTTAGLESLPSPETPVQLTSTGGLVIAAPAQGLPSTAAGIRVYIGNTSGGETFQGVGSGIAPFTFASPLQAGAAPPTVNNTICQQVANDAMWPVGTGYNVTMSDSQGNMLPGYPSLWQLLGAGTTINLSNGLPYYHGVVTFPSPILASPLNHTAQSISGPLNLGGYGLSGTNLSVSNSFNAQYFPPTIQSAITAAGAAGSVGIPANYAGTDGFSANPSGVQVFDQRPLSNTNAAINTVYAAQYGALCNGSTDDTAAIQAAINAAYSYNLPVVTHEQMTVVLPQGSCLIEQPLELGQRGSLVGQGDSTYLVCDWQAWRGTDDNCLEMITNGPIGGGASIGQRRIGNFSIIGIGNASVADSTAIYIANNANITDTLHVFENLSFDNLQISDFDTGINAQDFANSQITNVNMHGERVGLNFNGDVVNISVSNTNIFTGTWLHTSNHTLTYGVMVQPNNKYTNGTCNVNLYCGPQGVTFYHTFVLSFDTLVYQAQCLACVYQNNTFDQAADGALSQSTLTPTGYALQLGPQAVGDGLFITGNNLGTQNPAGPILYSQMTGSGTASVITGNYFFLDAGLSLASAIGIDLVGSSAVTQLSINDNKFSNLSYGIVLAQPLTYSTIRGNTGGANNTLIWLSGAASLVHTATTVDGNTDASNVLVVTEGTASGMRIGWNQSPTQFLGTQTVSAAGCTIASGAVGNQCAEPVILTWPNAFPDSTYTFTCSVQSPTQPTGIGVMGIVNGATISVNEVAQNASSVGGGQINCTGTHN